ncbi:MAG: trypsin-like peptidase domain-containing protein [bacterium]
MVSLGLAIALLLVFLFPQQLGPSTPLERSTVPQQNSSSSAIASYAGAVSHAAPSVVNIYTSKTVTRETHPLYSDPAFKRFFPDSGGSLKRERETSLGSGVIIDSSGYVLTNNHVIQDADQIELLTSRGERVTARAIGGDPETDIAVLKVDKGNLPGIVITSSAGLRVGDVVLAIGNPFGVGQTVTQGIISATGRNQLGLNTFEDFIQTDAAINPGNSGGALVNSKGELVGINTAIFSRSGGSQGIGFAIPVNLAMDVMKQIIAHGQVIRGWLGVEGGDIPEELVNADEQPIQHGVVLTRVFPNGPGAEAGLQANDILTEINDTPVEDVRSALNTIAMSRPGDRLKISGYRDGKPFSTDAEVTIRPLHTEDK